MTLTTEERSAHKKYSNWLYRKKDSGSKPTIFNVRIGGHYRRIVNKILLAERKGVG
jgi:hypothetical protein